MSKKQKLTPWFPVSVKPARVGIYQTQADSQIWEGKEPYSFWDGSHFNWVSVYFDMATALRHDEGAGELVTHWRGLAKEPK